MSTFKIRLEYTILLLLLTIIIFIAGSALSPAKASSGNSYYVAPNGDDTNPGTIDQPWRTLAPVHAKDFLPGDVIHFKRGGVWSGGMIINDSGVEGNPITFTDYGTGNRPVFTNPGGQGSRSPIEVYADWIVVESFFVQDAYAAGISIANGADHNVIRNIEATNTGFGITIYGQYNLAIGNYLHDLNIIVNTPGGNDDYGAVGIMLFNSDNEISYNIIEKCMAPSYDYGIDGGAVEWWGVADRNYVHHNWATISNGFLEVGGGSARDTVVAYNVSVNNGSFSTIHLSGPFASSVVNFRIEHNTIVETKTDYQGYVLLGFEGDPTKDTALVRNNIFWIERGSSLGGGLQKVSDSQGFSHQNNLYHLIGEVTIGFDLGSGEKIADPLFANLGGRDFHLQFGSPAIDRGLDLGYYRDFDDRSVPFGAAPDIGAFEHRAVEPTSTSVPPPTSVPSITPTTTPSRTPTSTSTLTPSETPSTTPLPADLNGDGKVDVLDTQLCVNVVLGTETDPVIVARADVNKDGKVNVLDVQIIVNLVLSA
jgi:hypothetical protein